MRPLKIYIKVLSVDGSDRHCIEGYGFTSLPLEAGSVEFVIKTWRPLFHFQERLKSFFLGGSPDLLDFKFNNIEEVYREIYQSFIHCHCRFKNHLIDTAFKQKLAVMSR